MQERLWLRRYIEPLVTASGAEGLRDDVAELRAAAGTIVTLDTLVEARHFLSTDPLNTVGEKLVRVNASDIYAKGALPAEALLSIAWPQGRSEIDFADLLAGIGKGLAQTGASLIGGDLVSTQGPLTLSLTLTGGCLGAGPIRRSGARVGDAIYLGGEIGWGGLGLAAARGGGAQDMAARYQQPQIATPQQAHTVAARASASMDVSDGLLLDATRLAEASGVGLHLALETIPFADPAADLNQRLAQCTAGDDYVILMTAPAGLTLDGFTQIGAVTNDAGLTLTDRGHRVNLPSTLGFEHK